MSVGLSGCYEDVQQECIESPLVAAASSTSESSLHSGGDFQLIVSLVAVVYLTVKTPNPLPLLAAVFPLQKPPESIMAMLVAVMPRIWLVFVKSHVPALACGPCSVMLQPPRPNPNVQLKSLSRSIAPLADGALKVVRRSVALPVHVIVVCPRPEHLPRCSAKVNATDSDDVPLVGVVPLRSAVVHSMRLPEYLTMKLVEAMLKAVEAGETSARAVGACAARALMIRSRHNIEHLKDRGMGGPSCQRCGGTGCARLSDRSSSADCESGGSGVSGGEGARPSSGSGRCVPGTDTARIRHSESGEVVDPDLIRVCEVIRAHIRLGSLDCNRAACKRKPDCAIEIAVERPGPGC
jgi:hypothetical protein